MTKWRLGRRLDAIRRDVLPSRKTLVVPTGDALVDETALAANLLAASQEPGGVIITA